MNQIKVLCFGGGLNSTAAAIGMLTKGINWDASLFADTGAELPETYRHVEAFSRWCVEHGAPEIVTVRVTGELLEANCLRRKALPSVSYGYKTCSQRWKLEPQDKWLNAWYPAQSAWARGEKVIKIVGFDADEPGRARPYEDKKFVNWYPLVEWGWGRDECAEVVGKEGFWVPKSSCFFCANRTESEYRAMRETHPDFLERAIRLEENADLTDIKGLKRDYSLRQLLSNGELFCFTREACAACYDGQGMEAKAA